VESAVDLPEYMQYVACFLFREDPWELERRNLIIYEDRKLGSGAFGSVYLGKLVGINRLKNAGNNLSIGKTPDWWPLFTNTIFSLLFFKDF
jgi:hypothetical protein